ncbi:MAG: hypothetical protein MI757_08545 [Pirellulales bacterium]|nr:hypothetical protein [Pirellulales bacterium]
MDGTETALSTLDASATFEQEFLFLRAKILESAAVLDRVDRGDGTVGGDPRMERVLRAVDVLRDGAPNRAEQIQLIFSREYDADWRETFGV